MVGEGGSALARAGGVLALDLDGVLFVWPEPAGVAGVHTVPSGVSRGIIVVDAVRKSMCRGDRRGGVWLLTVTVVCACGKCGSCARVRVL